MNYHISLFSRAYEVLSDKEKRALYDEGGEQAFEPNKGPGGGGGGGFNFGTGGTQGGQRFEFKDPFEMFARYYCGNL